MSKQSGYARNIFFSIIISLLVLLSLGFLSIKYLVPIYDLQTQDIYRFLIYLLPILIGLVLIEIGSIISSKEKKSDVDTQDLLPKNSYDAPLFSTINDDPSDKYDSTLFETITPTITKKEYNLDDFLDKRVSNFISKYNTNQILDIFNNYEKPKTVIESPFDEETTQELAQFDEQQIRQAISWINNGSKVFDDKTITFKNFDARIINKLKNTSQREFETAFEFLDNNDKYYNFENIDEKNLCALSKLDNSTIEKALKWISIGSPDPADPKAVVLDNIDRDTVKRIKDYNSTQINVGLDYIDIGAPDILPSDFVQLSNLNDNTLKRLTNLNDSYVNKCLDIMKNDFINNVDEITLDRLNSYSKEQIDSAIEYLDNGTKDVYEDLPFGSEINNAIRALSIEEAKSAIEYINNPISLDNDLGDISNNLEDFLNSELKDNENEGYNFDISLAIFDKENVIDSSKKDILFSYLPSYTYVFDTDKNQKAIIFPYENIDNAKNHIDNLLKNNTNIIDNIENIKIGFASRNNRKIDASILINEAQLS